MDDNEDLFPGDAEIVDAELAGRMSDVALLRSKRMAVIRSRYLETRRDKEIAHQIEILIGNAAVSAGGHHDPRRCLAIIGPTGAGKTSSTSRAIAARPEFGPRRTLMTTTAPIVWITAPRPSNLLGIAYEILEALAYPLERALDPVAAWRMVRRQLKVREVRFVFIDEAQHMLNMRDHASMQQLGDALKTLMESRDWPVSFILCGMPELSDFLTIYGQIARRSHKILLEGLELPRDEALVSWIVRTIVEKHARMTFAFETDGEFLARICHAANAQLGVLTQIVRGAVERVLIDDVEGSTIRKVHFVRAYEAFSGCRPDQNVISARDWEVIQPQNALLREEELARVRVLEALADRAAALEGRRRRRKRKEV